MDNIDNFLREMEDRYGFDFQADFGRIEDHIQAMRDDHGDISDLKTDTEWKQYPGERAHEEYEWWRTVLNERKESVPYFDKSVTVVATVQVSSVAVERVFPQLTFIWNSIGDNTLW